MDVQYIGMKKRNCKSMGAVLEGTVWFVPILAAVLIALKKCDTREVLSFVDGPLVAIVVGLVILYGLAVFAGDGRSLSRFHGTGTVAAVSATVAYRVLGAVPPSVSGIEEFRLALALAVLWFAVYFLATVARLSSGAPARPDEPSSVPETSNASTS